MVGALLVACITGVFGLIAPLVARRVAEGDKRRALAMDVELYNELPAAVREGAEGAALERRIRQQLTSMGVDERSGDPGRISGSLLGVSTVPGLFWVVMGALYLGAAWLLLSTLPSGRRLEGLVAGFAGALVLGSVVLLGMGISRLSLTAYDKLRFRGNRDGG